MPSYNFLRSLAIGFVALSIFCGSSLFGQINSCGLATTANNYESAVTQNITSGSPAISTILVTGAGVNLIDLNLTTFITHSFGDDLEITLTSPLGTTTVITTDNGDGNDNTFNGTVWDDAALSVVSDFTYTNLVVATPLQPEGAMAAFRGEDPNGIWTLSIVDDAGGDDGELNRWSLDLVTSTLAPQTAPVETFTNTTVAPINDNQSFTSSITVTTELRALTDVNLTTFITHSFPSDLDISLTSPAGRTIIVTTDNGGTFDDAYNGTVWNDSAPNPATDNQYSSGVVASTLIPEGNLGAFIGEDPNGEWTLTVGDDAAGDTGNLHSWSLDFTACIPASPLVLLCPTGTGFQTIGDAIMAIPPGGSGTIVASGRDYPEDIDLTVGGKEITFRVGESCPDVD